MSLLVLKTKDLTWQDHTLNIEAMLAPTRSQLLVNKHKSYDARVTSDKEQYDKQIITRLKDYAIEKRMMERRREKINKRKKDILRERGKSADCRPARTETDNHDAKSTISDSHLLKRRASLQSPNKPSAACPPISTADRISSLQNYNRNDVTYEDVENEVFFVTELGKQKTHKLPSVYKDHQSRHLDTKNRIVSIKTNSSTHTHQHSTSKMFDTQGNLKPLQNRVEDFLQEQKLFNEHPHLNSSMNAWDKFDEKFKSRRKPKAANKLHSLVLDTGRLEEAFDEFCFDNSKEHLHKLVKIAAKMKANVTIARNQSWIPALAALRCSRKFINTMAKKKTDETKS